MIIPNLTEDQVEAINDGFEENILNYKYGENGWYEQYLEKMGYRLENRIAIQSFRLITDCADNESSTDFENAIILYEALESTITPAVASSGGFWTAMVHSNMYYMAFRWPAEEDTEKRVRARYLMNWSPSRRDRERNGMSRLWWAVYLTEDKGLDDRYLLTRELFSNQDLLTNVLDRESFNRDVTHALMKFLISERENGTELGRSEIRAVMKHLFTLDRSIVLFALDEATIESKLHEYITWYRGSKDHLNDET